MLRADQAAFAQNRRALRKAEWVDVKTGLTSGPLVEVFGDLRAGDEIASRGTDEMRPGTEVAVKEPKPATS